MDLPWHVELHYYYQRMSKSLYLFSIFYRKSATRQKRDSSTNANNTIYTKQAKKESEEQVVEKERDLADILHRIIE